MDSQTELFLAMRSMLASGKYSDFTIITQTRRYPVHKALLCPRSSFFDAACSSGFLEASNSEIDLTDEDPEAVEQMIQWFYHMDYLIEQPVTSMTLPMTQWRQPSTSFQRPRKLDLSAVEDPLVATANLKINARPPTPPASPQALRGSCEVQRKRTPSPDAASTGSRRARSRVQSRGRESSQARASSKSDYFTIDHARSEDEWVSETDTSDLVMHARIYSMAEKFGIPTLKELAKRKFEVESQIRWDDENLVDAMEEVYTGTVDHDRGLRDVVVHLLRKHENLTRNLEIQELIDDVAGLGHDVECVQRGIPIRVS